ncbi:MAG: Na+/H+ antiporter NhaC [Clostridiales bacterium]|nr:Na+/H+ antiporter NhaC [Clostridiales bacterium]
MKEKKQAKLSHALITIAYLIVALYFGMQVWGADVHMPILSAAMVAGAISIFVLGFTWAELEEGIVETIKMAMGAILILMIIGMIIGTWILSGIVPTMIFYGLKIISPGIFLMATLLITSVVSLATGSSWTTAGTVGIALIGVGGGFGIPLPIVAGAIISGAYFGDKMSPLSDTTNLAPAVAGSNLFDHIRHMIFTTGPSYLIALVLYGIIGMKYSAENIDLTAINEILSGISSQFTINPLLLLAPILVIVMVVMKIPAIPGLIGGVILGGIFAAAFQGAGMADIIGAAHYGFESATGIEAIDNLLSRGGLDSMMWTVSLILIAMVFGGIMEKSGMLNALAAEIMKFATTTGNLVLATILTVIAFNLIAGDQYLAIVIPGRMYKPLFDERGLDPKNLSRILEDSGTLTSPLVPWNSCGLFMSGTLGVATIAYAPYAFLNLLNPLVSIFYGYTGITMTYLGDEKKEKKKK